SRRALGGARGHGARARDRRAQPAADAAAPGPGRAPGAGRVRVDERPARAGQPARIPRRPLRVGDRFRRPLQGPRHAAQALRVRMAALSLSLRPALIAVLLGDLAVATAYPLLWAIGDAVPWRLSALVDPRGDANLIAWYVSVQLALLACGLALLACMQTDRRGPGWWCLVALPVVF